MWAYARRWGGIGLMAGGLGLLAEHYSTYGYTLHLVPWDHGVLGLVLVVAGAILAAGEPGKKAPPPS